MDLKFQPQEKYPAFYEYSNKVDFQQGIFMDSYFHPAEPPYFQLKGHQYFPPLKLAQFWPTSFQTGSKCSKHILSETIA